MAFNEKVSKPTKNQLELAKEITNEHLKIILEIIQTAEGMDRTLHGTDVGANMSP